MKEEWRVVPDYTDYVVSSFGRVWSIKHNKLLALRPIKTGYNRVMLYSCGKTKDYYVHRLVAKAFIPNPDGKPEVNHKDGIKSHNYAENLEWSTRSENQRHSYDTGLSPRGEIHYNSKLKEVDVIEINRRLSIGEDGKVLAKEYSVGEMTISRIKNRHTWSHIPSNQASL